MSIVPIVAAVEYAYEREQAAKAHARKETAKRHQREEKRHADEARFAREAEERVETFEAKAKETLPAEETRTVREIRESYDKAMDQYHKISDKERVLTNDKRAELVAKVREMDVLLKQLEEERKEALKAADKRIGWWDRWINGIEVDERTDKGVLAVKEKIRDAAREMWNAKRDIEWDDKRLADPMTEVDRLTREQLRVNAEALAAQYPWVTRSPHSFPGPFDERPSARAAA